MRSPRGGAERPGAHVSDRWASWRGTVDLEAYDRRWEEMAAAGQAVHGEADLIASLHRSPVLDAGCGTGRLAIELARRGLDVVGVDLDEDLLAVARQKEPELAWVTADLATMQLGRRFAVARLGEQVATEEGAGQRLHQQATLPAMWHVRRVEPLHRVAAECQLLAIGQRAR